MTVSTHVLDTRRGRPAGGVPVRLDRHDGEGWRHVAEGATDEGGHWSAGAGAGEGPAPGTYRLRFGTGPYFAAQAVATCYPEISVIFAVPAEGGAAHVPVQVGPFGYATCLAG